MKYSVIVAFFRIFLFTHIFPTLIISNAGADIFAKYALRKAGITRNVLIDKEGRIVKLTRLYNPEEFASLVKEIDGMLSE